jgi:predicted trehalose synthase
VTSSRAAALLASLDAEGLAAERWFADKGRSVRAVRLVDAVEAGDGVLAVADVELDGARQRYALVGGAPIWGPLLELAARGGAGAFRFRAAGGGLGALGRATERPLDRDQSNSSYLLGERLVLKCYRLLRPGPHPEVELVSYLTEAGFAAVPPAAGSLVWADGAGEWPVALVQGYVRDAEDGWAWSQASVRRSIEASVDTGWAGELGRVVAGLHDVLAAASGPGLAPRRASPEDLRAWRKRAEATARQAGVVDPWVFDGLRALGSASPLPLLTRVHGDLHVGQVLRSPAGLHLVDFEGEPTRPIAERRRLDTPHRDVASLVRSFANVARWALRDADEPEAGAAWVVEARRTFLEAYEREAPHPLDHELLCALELEKALYEIAYAAAYLPEWMPVARAGLADVAPAGERLRGAR